jgi:hypothetical protein
MTNLYFGWDFIMWNELRYRWALRKYLKAYAVTKLTCAAVTDFTRAEGEPDIQRAQQKEQDLQQHEIGALMTEFLVERAYLYYIPVPQDEDSWLHSRYLGKKFLTQEAARKLHEDIRAEQKAIWEFWQSRVTFALALVGSIFGVLAFFK